MDKDIWIIGDTMLKDLFYAVCAMKKPDAEIRHSNSSSSEPDIHRYFNVKPFEAPASFVQHNTLTRLVNTLTKACYFLLHILWT